jgi:hypothetical protein
MALLASADPAGAEPPPPDPLEAYVVDVSAWPTVLVDVVVPWEYATADIEPAMIELEGGRTESVIPVDPIGSVVGLVIDDGPTVPRGVVYSAQGASVELVRNVGEGTAIALSTPSGMQTTPTTDRGASIARIAGITAGAPDVVPLHRLVLDAARRIAKAAWPDRHLVLVLGRPISEAPTLRELADIVDRGDIRLHVVADPGIDTGAIASLAERTGGEASKGGAMLAEVDDVTAAIAHRVRLATTVTGAGPLELTLTVDGDRFATEVELPAAPSATSASPRSTGTSPNDSRAAAPVATGVSGTAPPTTPAASRTAEAADSGSSRGRQLLIAGPLVAVGLAAVAWLWLRARRRAATQPAVPAPPASPRRDRVVTPARVPDAAPRSAEPAPETEGADLTARPEVDDAAADGALTAGRRGAAERPHLANPPPRASKTASPPPEDELPQQEEDPGEAGEWLVVGRIRLSHRSGEVFAGTRRISLTPGEFAVLELLMTRGGHGVTRDAIRAAASTGKNGEEAPDPDAILAELRRKTGIRGRGQGMRQERALVYFFGD